METALPDYPIERFARHYPFDYPDDERADLARGLQLQYPSTDVARWAARFPAEYGPTDTMGLLRTMTLAINEQFIYSRRIERGVQTPSETLQRGQGTCRDFALLMIEAVRYLGLAARFVSGYIFVPEADPALAAGSGSTHAWLQVYLPGAGWVDFDPTNRIIGNRTSFASPSPGIRPRPCRCGAPSSAEAPPSSHGGRGERAGRDDRFGGGKRAVAALDHRGRLSGGRNEREDGHADTSRLRTDL